MIRPDLVLFNGGFFTPPVARERIAQALAGWFGRAPRLLATGNLEAAVAVGAATYARLRAGIGRAGSARESGQRARLLHRPWWAASRMEPSRRSACSPAARRKGRNGPSIIHSRS